MAKQSSASKTKRQIDASRKISGIRAEFALAIAAVCFVVGFTIGRIFDSISLQPRSRDLQVQRVIDSPRIKDDEWISELVEQAKAAPNDADKWTALGNAYFDTSRFPQAIEAYKASLEIEPNDADVVTDLGIMYRRIGESTRAADLFDQAAAIDPSHEMSRFNKGVVLLHDLQDPKGAAEAWNALLKLNPEFRSPTGQRVDDMVRALESSE